MYVNQLEKCTHKSKKNQIYCHAPMAIVDIIFLKSHKTPRRAQGASMSVKMALNESSISTTKNPQRASEKVRKNCHIQPISLDLLLLAKNIYNKTRNTNGECNNK